MDLQFEAFHAAGVSSATAGGASPRNGGNFEHIGSTHSRSTLPSTW